MKKSRSQYILCGEFVYDVPLLLSLQQLLSNEFIFNEVSVLAYHYLFAYAQHGYSFGYVSDVLAGQLLQHACMWRVYGCSKTGLMFEW